MPMLLVHKILILNDIFEFKNMFLTLSLLDYSNYTNDSTYHHVGIKYNQTITNKEIFHNLEYAVPSNPTDLNR
jgi:hypothetical protein